MSEREADKMLDDAVRKAYHAGWKDAEVGTIPRERVEADIEAVERLRRLDREAFAHDKAVLISEIKKLRERVEALVREAREVAGVIYTMRFAFDRGDSRYDAAVELGDRLTAALDALEE
jgi:hypothetical protein